MIYDIHSIGVQMHVMEPDLRWWILSYDDGIASKMSTDAVKSWQDFEPSSRSARTVKH